MGIVQREPTFDDDYSREIIARARDLSPEIDEYVITQRYLLETQEENLTPEWLRNRVLTQVIGQLAGQGILFNQDSDVILDQPLLIDAVLVLRSKFDKDKFVDLLKEHQELRDELTELVDDDCIADIIDCCSRNLPLDEGWESLSKLIADRPGIIFSVAEFNELIDESIERCQRLGDDPIFSDDDMGKMLEYSKFLADRKNKIAKIASTIYSTSDAGVKNDDRMSIVLEAMKDFEKELSRPDAIRQYIDGEFTPGSFIEKRRAFHLSKWRHCIEFYLAQEVDDVEAPRFYPSDMETSILVATLYVDAPDKTHARVYVVEMFENAADQLGDRYPKFRELIDKALGNLVVVEGAIEL